MAEENDKNGVFVLSASMARRLIALDRKVTNMSVTGAAFFKNTADTLAIGIGLGGGDNSATSGLLVRIAGAHTGQGKYDAYVVNRFIDAERAGTNLGTLQNVMLGDSGATMGQKDGERVIVWNAWERDTNPADPITGTNRVHLLGGGFIPGGMVIGSEQVESSTNRRRIVLVNWLPSLGCDTAPDPE